MNHRVAYIGNFQPEHSTENHVREALESLDVEVVMAQENTTDFDWLIGDVRDLEPDFVLWTRTWTGDHEAQCRFLDAMRAANIPTIGYHLDRWFGLSREHLVHDEPFFRCQLVITADGGHEDAFRRAGVNHVWMPPAVSHVEAARVGVHDDQFDWDVIFVGSWRAYGHLEWQHRSELITSVASRYGPRFRPYEAGVRGQALADCYHTARVVIGDSCLAGNATHYWSDRIPETLGRGGFLIHPQVIGLGEHFTPGQHLVTYTLGDFATLHALIDHYLDHGDERERIAAAGRAHVLEQHTYRHRMAAVVDYAESLRDLKSRSGRALVVRDGVTAGFDLGPDDGVVVDEVWNGGVYPLKAADVAGRVVVDIGANVGAFTIWAARAGARKVWAYEPDADNLVKLQHNLDINGLFPPSVVVIGEAVSGHSGETWMGDSGAQAHIVDAPDTLTAENPIVVLRSLDEVLLRAGERLVVKMDCEGCEHEALTLVDPGHLRRVDRLVMEYHEGPLDDGTRWPATAWGRLTRVLAEHGMVTTMGRPSTGLVNIDWKRYGA